jgi:hypothetical protein
MNDLLDDTNVLTQTGTPPMGGVLRFKNRLSLFFVPGGFKV